MSNGVIVSKVTKSLVVPRNGKTANLFPEAHVLTDLNQDFLVVPHDVRNTVLLRAIGYQTPNPMLYQYAWPGGTPFAVQKATCDLMTSHPRSYVLNSMGCGKTRSALWAWDYLYGNGLCGKLLVVATLSTLHFVWAREAFQVIPGRKVAVLHGTKQKRLEALNQDADIYIINHDGVKVIEPDLLTRTDIDVLCLDELAVYRNNSDRSKRMRKMAQRFKIVWGLTGRPMPNEPTDVWGQAQIVTPGTVPKFRRLAEELLMTKITQFKLVPKPDAVETAFKWLQPSVRFDLDAVIELPPVVHRTMDVPLSDQQKKTYQKLASLFQADVNGHKITAVNAGVVMNKLLQVAGGYVYAGDKNIVDVDGSQRIQTCIDLVEEAEHKVLIYVPYVHALEGISAAFTKAGIEHATVHGEVKNRDEIFNLFQNTTKFKALIAHPLCMAHGLTLTAADTIIWYLPITSLEIYEQANARITRIGQKHRQQVFHLQSTAVEKKIYSMLRTKQNIQDALLELLEEATNAKYA